MRVGIEDQHSARRDKGREWNVATQKRTAVPTSTGGYLGRKVGQGLGVKGCGLGFRVLGLGLIVRV